LFSTIPASNLHLQSVTQVKAAMLCDITHGKGSNNKPLETETQNLDPNSRIAKFPRKKSTIILLTLTVKFTAGTKKAPGFVRFGMQIQVAGTSTPITVESNTSNPMVIITNECQWEGSAGTLLKKETFSNGQVFCSQLSPNSCSWRLRGPNLQTPFNITS
jgi:hypothetical protein